MKTTRVLTALIGGALLFCLPAAALAGPFDYDFTGGFSGGAAPVCRDGLWGLAGPDGQLVCPLTYESPDELPAPDVPDVPDEPDDGLYSHGLAPTHDFDTGLYGYTDQNGRVVVPPRYQYAAPFSNGLARVMRDGLWGFIDTRGCEVIPPVYLYARDFDEVGAWVQTGSGRLLISLEEAQRWAAAFQPDGSLYAFPSPARLQLGGRDVSMECYEIAGSSYVALRDAALLFSRAGKSLSVGWDAGAQAVVVATGGAYTPVGGELQTPDRQSRLAVVSPVSVVWDGRDMALSVYEIGGRSFMRLRDILALLDVSVSWDAAQNLIAMDASAPYEGEKPWEKPQDWLLPDPDFDLSRMLGGNPAGQVRFLYSVAEFCTAEMPQGVYGVGTLDPAAVFDAGRTFSQHLDALDAVLEQAFGLSLQDGVLADAGGESCFAVVRQGSRLGLTIMAWRHSPQASGDGAVYQNAALEMLQYLSGSDEVGAALWSLVDALQLDVPGSTGDFGFTSHEGQPQSGVLVYRTGARVAYDMQTDGQITFWFEH